MLYAIIVWLYLTGGFATATVIKDSDNADDLRKPIGWALLAIWPILLTIGGVLVVVERR